MFSSKPLVFISYSRKDKTNADQLRSRLSKRGMKVWMDTQDITAGPWQREIKIGLRRANFFIACLSPNTAQPGEVLQSEYDSALEIQRERLEGEIFIIPVRLEPSEIPECFRHLQYLDLYDPAGWDALIGALRSKARIRWDWIAVLALVLVLGAVAGYMWLQSSPLNELLAARNQGKAAVTGNTIQLGVTLWKMEPSEDADPPSIREIFHPPPSSKGEVEPEEWTPVRLPPGATFRLNDRFQVGIESSRLGYLYVVNRSFRQDGSEGPASLIFPTRRIHGGDNELWASRMLRLPARSSKPPYWVFNSSRPDYAGELLLILLTPQPLPGNAQEEATLIDDETVAGWRKQFGDGVRLKSYETPQLRLTPEEAAARDQDTELTRTAPPPEFIFEAKRAPGTAVFCTLKIPMRAKP